MVKWISKDDCTGCEACLNICPVNAIRMVPDSMGFYCPTIGNECTDCGECENVCKKRLSIVGTKNTAKKAYIAINKNEKVRFTSTSGGIFFELGKAILNDGGCVVGAGYLDGCKVAHFLIDSVEELQKLMQSKYVQSRVGYVYRDISDLLNEDKKVLFCGTPCQVVALKTMLHSKALEKLYTLDFICMGVNSPLAYSKWLEELENHHGSKVNKVWFKYKDEGWNKSPFTTKIEFENGEGLVLRGEDNLYMRAFLEKRCIIRKTCSRCRFKGDKRLSDITVGDFWGVKEEYDDDKGTSAVIINSSKGSTLVGKISDKVLFYSCELKDIKKGNLHYDESVCIADCSEDFLMDLNNSCFSEVFKEYN